MNFGLSGCFISLPILIGEYWRAKLNTTYFTATNPLMNNSGAINSSKYHYLSKLPKHWHPKTTIVKKSISAESLRSILASNTLSFPLILKPDNGERGKEVKLVHTLEQLFQALEQSHYPNLLLQSFCSYTKEAAFLYVRKPNEKMDEFRP